MFKNRKKPLKQSKGNVLIVDDNSLNLKVLTRILAAEGYEIALAMEAKQMFEHLDNEIPDLILLDIMMPDMDGYTACTKLKSMDRWKDIPVIFLTALSGSRNMMEGYNCGAVDFITKPFEPLEVLARVKTHVALKQALLELKRLKIEKERDSSIIEEQQKLLETMAITDKLTNLVNKKFAEHQIDDEIARYRRTGQMFCLALCAVDQLDEVVDLYGVEAKNTILKNMSDFFIEIKRKQDIVARWDDEIFMIIMPHTESEGAYTFTNRLREHVEKMSHSYEDRSIKVTITLGVAEYNKVMEKLEIIERTEGALINGIRL
ncbi:response regulator, partial [Methanococcoides sp. SA1]|nr:response regulator [Methanococcoides sp. SA1]